MGNRQRQLAKRKKKGKRQGKQDTQLVSAYNLILAGRYDEAEPIVKRVLSKNPDNITAIDYLGTILVMREDYQSAIDLFKSKPENKMLKRKLFTIYIHTGQLMKAWTHPDLEEPIPSLQAIPWKGEPINDKCIFIYSFYDLGEDIQYTSCIPDLQAKKIIFATNKRLVPIFNRSFPGIEAVDADKIIIHKNNVVQKEKKQLFTIDIQTDTLQLPRYFRQDMDSFPDRSQHLYADPELIRKWEKRFDNLPGLKVGISWKGGKEINNKIRRSIPLEDWTPILSTPGISWINLQYGDCQSDIKNMPIHDWPDVDPLKDLETQAAQMAAMDLVITIDTTAAHLAGALGVKTWVMLPTLPAPAWFQEREDSPWYPSARLFRQEKHGDWRPVIERVAIELQKLLEINDRQCYG